MRLLLLAMALTACHRPVVRPDPPVVAPVTPGCLTKAPHPHAHWTDTACQPGLVCIPDDEARALVEEVEDRRRWDAAAWAACGPSPSGNSPDHPGRMTPDSPGRTVAPGATPP